MIKKIIPVICALSAVLLMYNAFLSASAPGSASDPLVSKSYVDERIDQILNLLSGANFNQSGTSTNQPDTEAIVAIVVSRLEHLYGDRLTGQATSAFSSYVPVFAQSGQIILGGEGTEIILRSGSADGFCHGTNGLVDITSGQEIFNGQPLGINHLIIIPRDDGRGVIIRNDAWFIIKGSYRILS
jgi:hypothetical protein